MKFELYTKPGCPYCEKAKELLQQRGHQYKEINLSDTVTKATIQNRVNTVTENVVVQTVPQIFLLNAAGGETYIGGYTELRRQIDSL